MVFSQKFMTLMSLNKKKMVFQKTVGKRRLVDTHTKPKNRKDANPIRYFQNLKIARKRHLVDTCKISKKSWRHNVSVDIHNPNFKTKKQRFEKNLKFQKSWGGDIPSIPTKPNFWEKNKEATFSRYLYPNPWGSDIPSILATEWAKKRHCIDTCNTIQQGGDS